MKLFAKKKIMKAFAFVIACIVFGMAVLPNSKMGSAMAQSGTDQPETNISFETTASDQITASNKTSTHLGVVSDTEKGFSFRLNYKTNGQMKIGLYNTSKANPWTDGYILVLNRKDDQTLSWAVRTGTGEKLVAYNTLTVDMTEALEIYAWLTGESGSEKINITIGTTQIVTNASYAGVVCGTYMSVYNETGSAQTFYSMKKAEDKPSTKPDPEPVIPPATDHEPEQPAVPSEDITFEDLGMMSGKNLIKAASKTTTSLGSLEQKTHGVKLKIKRPDQEDQGANIRLGLYNTTENNPWADGYILNICRNTESEIGWALRYGTGEKLIEFGTLEDDAKELQVYIWISDVSRKSHKINVIVDSKWMISRKIEDGASLGKYFAVYNECKNPVELSTFRSVHAANTLLKTDQTGASIKKAKFEDLGQTITKNSVKVVTGLATDLGTVSKTSKGFKAKVTVPARSDAGKFLKIGLYNQSVRNPWADGYLFAVTPGDKNGELNWRFMLAHTEEVIDSGTISGITQKEFSLMAWLTDIKGKSHTIHVAVNGKELLVCKNDGSNAIGTYFATYHEGAQAITFYTYKTVKQANTVVNTKKNSYKSVAFEDIGHTKTMNQIELFEREAMDLGTLGSVKNGFKFRITVPKSADSGKNLKVGLYNTVTKNPWVDGYILAFAPQEKKGIIQWKLMLASTEEVLDAGMLTGINKDKLDVMVWLTDIKNKSHVVHVAIDGKEVTANKNDGSNKIGTYLSVYNEWSKKTYMYSYHHVQEPYELLKLSTKTYPTGGPVFEDFLKTVCRYSMNVPVAEVGNLGAVTDTKHGFSFKITAPKKSDQGKEVKIGFYNTGANNPWLDGYILVLTGGKQQNTVEWKLLEGKTEERITAGSFQAGSGSDLKVHACLTDVTSGGHTIHIALGGKEIVACRNYGSIQVGNNMAVYNGWDHEITVSTLNDMPLLTGDVKGITFEDMGTAARMNELKVPQAEIKHLGRLSSREHGFACTFTSPKTADYNTNLKIGLYNTGKKNTWEDGYILVLTPREDHTMNVMLIKGKDETRFLIADDLTGIDKMKNIQVQVWLTDIDAVTAAHTLHVMINGKEVMAYNCADGSVLTGKYMSVYSEWTNPVTFKTIKKVETLTDLYLKKFGDPTDINAVVTFDDPKEDIPETDTNRYDVRIWYPVCGAGMIVLIGLAILVIVHKNKKHKKDKEAAESL